MKQGGRSAALRYLRAKNDKEMIAAWKVDLKWVLQVFDVRSVCFTPAIANISLSDRVGN